eukprot:11394756-Karenia_brevis.AAC.1
MYGTRDAARNWEEHYSGILAKIGFAKGRASPCSFYHELKKIRIAVHGDDFLAAGPIPHLRWLREKIDEAYEAKHQVLGRPKWAQKSIRLLNRTISWEKYGLSAEADKKRVDEAVRELGLEGAKPVSTPGIREYEEERIRKKSRIEERKRRGDKDPEKFDDGRHEAVVGGQGIK